MELDVRPARPDDRAAPALLYVSAAPYYDAYAGSRERAVRMLEALWARPGHTASFDVTHVAVLDGSVVGVLTAFPAVDSDRLARRFLRLSVPRLPVWRWLPILRHLRASATVTPVPPEDALYVDALAVEAAARHLGVASRLLREAERLAAERGLAGVALDTGIDNGPARALYEGYGFRPGRVHATADERVARAVGGPGFVSYFKPL
jgi:GNAT superfamily N-acetyltransferase